MNYLGTHPLEGATLVASTDVTSDGTDISWAAAGGGISAGKALAFSIIF